MCIRDSGYDTGYYAEAYSGGYNSSPAPTGENASKPVFPTQSYFELLGPMAVSYTHLPNSLFNCIAEIPFLDKQTILIAYSQCLKGILVSSKMVPLKIENSILQLLQ